jgi:ABC-type transport system involved in multi-copper enzyme maturation permease subunit
MVFRDGAAAGVIGFVTIALFFVVTDAFAGHPFLYTPALLGGALFYGVTGPSDVTVALAPVLAYSAVHLIVLLVLGVIAAGFASVASRHRYAWFIGVNLFLLIVAHASGAVMTLTESLQGVVSAWLVTGATAAAAITMAVYLIWANPPLRRELGEREFPES